MNGEPRLSDELLREMFDRRSTRGTADGLRGAIVSTTSVTRQRPRKATVLGRGRAIRMLGMAALIGGVVAGGMVLAGRQEAIPMVEYGFVRPFAYPELAETGFQKPVQIGYFVAFPSGGGSEPYPTVEVGDGTDVIPPGSHGIVIASTADAVTHPCPPAEGASSRIPFREDPRGALEDFRLISGAGIGQPEAVTFDGRPALAAVIDPTQSRCDFSDFHVHGSGGIGFGYLRLNLPSRLIVTEVDGMTMVLQAWASSQEELGAWLPTAKDFLDHLHFTGGHD